MKKLAATLLAITVPVFSFSADSERTKGNMLGTANGRYTFGSVDGSILGTFMLDTETGRLWKYSVDKEMGLQLVPITYKLLDGSFSLVPAETKVELERFEAARTVGKLNELKGPIK